MKNKQTLFKAIYALLTHDTHDFWLRINQKDLALTIDGFINWYHSIKTPKTTIDEVTAPHYLCRYISSEIEKKYQEIESLHDRYGLFFSQTQRASTEEEFWQHQMTFLEFMKYSKRHIHKDYKAKKRWFGNDAIKDRYQNKIAELENSLCFLLQKLGRLIKGIGVAQSKSDTQNILSALNLEDNLTPLMKYEADERVAYEATSCLRVAYGYLDSGFIEQLDPALIQYAYRIASDPYQPIWVQTEALALLVSFGQESAIRLLSHRLNKPSTAEGDLFFRARAISIILEYQQKFNSEELGALTYLVLADPSIYVRQKLCLQLINMPNYLALSLFERLSKYDSAPQVRAKAWLVLTPLIQCLADQSKKIVKNEKKDNELSTSINISLTNYLDMYLYALENQKDGMMLRLLMEECVAIFKVLTEYFSEQQCVFYEKSHRYLTVIHTTHNETKVRRWAAIAREQLWHYQNRMHNIENLQSLSTLPFEKVKKVDCPDLSENELGRHLSTMNQYGIGLDISKKNKKLIARGGYNQGFRLWRFFHEWRTPSSNKRQNHNHTVGRLFHGHLQVPPQKLAESNETQVPGEPVLNQKEQGWRPYLPLVDQVLSSLDQGWPTKPVKLYTSEGVTEIHPPKNIFKRIWVKLYISFHFKRFSDLRNWIEQDDEPATKYLQSFKELGFTFKLTAYEEANNPLPVDSRVSRFFPAIFPFFSLSELYRELQNYFYSVYQNTLEQLTIFLIAAATIFFGHHFWINQEFRKARKSIPFVMGGWGTRGKSGTERLKAALFNSYGISLISKSTGCEAQFLYAPLNRPLKELFLFRPYDKASIWEQLHLTRLAAKLKVNMLLWECMGLTPRYINILQQQWMRDDLSTITNCYPDHEDIQGPSGIDIPKVMMRFVPKNATLITSEDTMSPLLEIAARENKSHCYHVNWQDGYFLAPDILSRFPYEEHPTNIALVTKMAEILGIPEDIALKSMADKVIPDLGVLKVYPECKLQNRRFIFINGMSANESLAALNNWQRLELNSVTPSKAPQTWLTTVVNNRADRISRSQVFAKMLANDLSADMHFLIGSNVSGLVKYIEAQWQIRMDRLPFYPSNKMEQDKLLQKFLSICQYLRIVMDESLIQTRIQSMLEGLTYKDAIEISQKWKSRDQFKHLLAKLNEDVQLSLLNFRDRAETELEAFLSWRKMITSPELDVDALREQLCSWFNQRFVIVDDEHISGNALIQLMMNNTPIGLCNKMIGLQNIKGTGLDFVYRWQGWQKTHELCQKLNGSNTILAQNAAKALSGLSDFGLLDHELVVSTCQSVREKKVAQTEIFQAELNAIESHAKQQIIKINENFRVQRKSRWLDKLIDGLESFLDAGMSVKRRRRAEQIYQDIAEQRISLERASVELQKINQEQKGGWLSKRMKGKLGNNFI
ncbi:MAG: hypothetical protein JXR16_08520 [Bermanella sp.]